MATKKHIGALVLFIVSVIAISCNHREQQEYSGREYVVYCVLTDTTNVQRMRLTVNEPGQTELKVVSPENVTTAYIAERGGSFYYFEYEDDGIWTTSLDPQDGINYTLTIKFNRGPEFFSGTDYPKRPTYKDGIRKYRKAYYPSTDDTVENVLWIPVDSSIDDFQSPSFLWFFLGQPQEGGGLRYSDYVATRSSNRANFFNKTSENIWGLSCWQEDVVSQIGWKTEIGYPSTTYNKAICLETQSGTQATDIVSYELAGDYDVNYALKHRPSADSDYGYVEPLLISDVHLVSNSLNTWLQNAIKDGTVDVSDILHVSKAIQGVPFNVNNDIYGCKATGVFGAESIMRFPIGSGQRDYAPPIELK